MKVVIRIAVKSLFCNPKEGLLILCNLIVSNGSSGKQQRTPIAWSRAVGVRRTMPWGYALVLYFTRVLKPNCNQNNLNHIS